MTAVARTARRHPWWMAAFTGLLVAGLVGIPRIAQAAPPANDTCAAPQAVPLATPIEGTTAEAVNNYEARDAANVLHVPSAGPDVVFEVTIPEDGPSVFFQATGTFRMSLYASIVNLPESSGGLPCAQVHPSGGAANPSTSLFLSGSDDTPTIWNVVLDGWTAQDKGSFTVLTTIVDSYDFQTAPFAPDQGQASTAMLAGLLGLQGDEVAAKLKKLNKKLNKKFKKVLKALK